MIYFNLNLISKYRMALMGLATVLILLTHAPAYGIVLPFHLNAILSASQIGVLIFFLVSGIGIYYSLDTAFTNKQSVIKWYQRRFARLFIPYLVIYGPVCALKCFQNNLSIVDFLFDISTISFWFGHETCWFVDMLVPIYLLAPLWFKLIKYFKYSIIPTSIAIIGAIATGDGCWIQASVFFAGFWLAKYIKGCVILNAKSLIIIALCICFTLALYYCCGIGYLLLILLTPLIIFFCLFLEAINSWSVNKIFNFFGGISLESYIFNTTLICWIDHFKLVPDRIYNYRYAFIVVFGTLFAYVVNKLCKPIIEKMS